MLVVFPEPLIPTRRITNGLFGFCFLYSLIKLMRFGGSVKTDRIDDLRDSRIVSSIFDLSIFVFTKSEEREDFIESITDKATLFSNKVISKSWNISSKSS